MSHRHSCCPSSLALFIIWAISSSLVGSTYAQFNALTGRGPGDLSAEFTHQYTIFADSDAFTLAVDSKRVPMSALSPWCNVPPERADEIIILTEPTDVAKVSVSFIGREIRVFGAMVAGFDQYAFWKANGYTYNFAFGYDKPACDIELGYVYPFVDLTGNTLTIEPKGGMQIAIFNVSSVTADRQMQTFPQTPEPNPNPPTTSTPITTSETFGSTNQAKKGSVPIEVIVAPTIIVGICLIAGLILLYVCLFRRRVLRKQRLYGPINWNAPLPTTTAPVQPMRQRDATLVPLPLSLFGSSSGESAPPSETNSEWTSTATATATPVQPYLLVQDSRVRDPPPKAALSDLANKRPVHAYRLPPSRRFPGGGAPGSSAHERPPNLLKASLVAWKAGPAHDTASSPASAQPVPAAAHLEQHPRQRQRDEHDPEPDSLQRISLASDGQSASQPPGPRDPGTLAALEQAVRRAGFSTQALLESLNRVREGRARAENGHGSGAAEDEGLPQYRV